MLVIQYLHMRMSLKGVWILMFSIDLLVLSSATICLSSCLKWLFDMVIEPQFKYIHVNCYVIYLDLFYWKYMQVTLFIMFVLLWVFQYIKVLPSLTCTINFFDLFTSKLFPYLSQIDRYILQKGKRWLSL